MEHLKKGIFALVFIAFISFGSQLISVPRALALTYSVTNTNDSGLGSFRQAILDANSTPGHDNIAFNIPGPGPYTINVLSGINATDPVTIDATNGGGSTCATVSTPAHMNVQLDFQGSSTLYLLSGSQGSIVKGLSLVNSNHFSLFVEDKDVEVKCNMFQFNPDGTENPNGKSVVNYVDIGSPSNGVVGGPNVEDRNYFTGTGYVYNLSDGLVVENNYFGVSLDGSSPTIEHNYDYGWVYMGAAASNPTIRDNVISNGVQAIATSNSVDLGTITITGNKIGTDATGTLAIPNSNHNINFSSGKADQIVIGGPNISDRNIIAASGAIGIKIQLTDGNRNIRIENNSIGLLANNQVAGNNFEGIKVESTGVGNLEIISNIIASNGGLNGLNAIDASNIDTVIQSNLIGTDITKTQDWGPAQSAIALTSSIGKQTYTIGGQAVKGNIIYNSHGHDTITLYQSGTGYSDIDFSYNEISGSNQSGIVFYGNNLDVSGVISNNVIKDSGADGIRSELPGTLEIHNNDILNSGDRGIRIGGNVDVEIHDNSVSGSYNRGISIEGGSNGDITNNTISNSTYDGIYADGSDVVVSGNSVSGSGSAGIRILGGSNGDITNNTITSSVNNGIYADGSDVVVSGNSVSGSGSQGIMIDGSSNSDITSNTITSSVNNGIYVSNSDVGISGNSVSGSGGNGVAIYGSSHGVVHDNVVTNNTLKGIVVGASYPGVVYQNIVHSNGGLNLDLNNDGYNVNDVGDSGSPLNYPVIRASRVVSGNTVVKFSTDLVSGDYRFDICYNPSGVPAGGACEVFKATLNIDGVQVGRQFYEISVPGTGYVIDRFTMQSVKRVGLSYVDSSEYGLYASLSSDLTVQSVVTQSMGGALSAVGPTASFGLIQDTPAYGLLSRVCNVSGETVTDFKLSSPSTNLSVSNYGIDPTSNATDNGAISSSGVWHGELRVSECVGIYLEAHVTGSIGQNMVVSPTVSLIAQSGGVDLIDSDNGNNSQTLTLPITSQPDIVIHSRLLTQGSIVNGTNVSYALTINNEGTGSANSGWMMLAFILPDDATFNGLVDTDLSDGVTLIDGSFAGMDPSGCDAPVIAHDASPGLAAYDGQLVRCVIGVPGGAAPGFTTSFRLDMTAGSGFVSGSTRAIVAVLDFSEEESLRFMNLFMSGQDGFTLGINNVAWLTYDSDPLTVTINRCPGVNETVMIDDGCFTITFNKEIYAPSFTVSNLILEGGGSIYSFMQNSPYSWTIRVTGMTPGATLRISVVPGTIYDYSAITNGTQVLGENIIRYLNPGTQNNGQTQADGQTQSTLKATNRSTLPNTGTQADPITPLILILTGYLLTRKTRKHA